MTESIAVHPPTKRLSGRLVALIAAIAFGVAAIAVVVLLALAVNDPAEPASEAPIAPTESNVDTGGFVSTESCESVAGNLARC
jgi:hypothetical protein